MVQRRAPWFRGRNSAQAKDKIGKDLPVNFVYTNVTSVGGAGKQGELSVAFDKDSSFPGSDPFSARENIYKAVEKDGVIDFLILTNGNSTSLTTVFALSRSPKFSDEYKAMWEVS